MARRTHIIPPPDRVGDWGTPADTTGGWGPPAGSGWGNIPPAQPPAAGSTPPLSPPPNQGPPQKQGPQLRPWQKFVHGGISAITEAQMRQAAFRAPHGAIQALRYAVGAEPIGRRTLGMYRAETYQNLALNPRQFPGAEQEDE